MVLDDGTWGISPYIPHWSAACQVSLSYFISSATGSKSTPVQSSPLMPRHSSPFSSEPGPLIFLQGGQNVLFQSRSKSTIGQIKTSKINQNQWLSWSCNLLRSSPCKLEMINYSQCFFSHNVLWGCINTQACATVDSQWEAVFALSYGGGLNVYIQMRST